MEDCGARVVYPMEGHTGSWVSGKVSAAVVSPPARLLKRLLLGRQGNIESLTGAGPTPMEWLIAPDHAEPESEQPSWGDLGQRTFSVPSDFGDEPPVLPVEPDAETERYGDEATEPNFFGNRILNDTSLVIALDVWLDGKRRRRILLTGDQENWSYIASRHPAGLGVDVLKVPHHGGMVYLADDKGEDQNDRGAGVVEQAYLWLKPRIAIMSARGTYDLPHTRVRDALRATGAAVLCTNVRGLERISPPASDLEQDHNCYRAYGCGAQKQPSRTILTLTSDSEKADRPACVSDSGGRGVAPIVVMTQRVVDPDEAFVRWTRTELEKHALWLKGLLVDARTEFAKAIAGKGLLAAMECSPVAWFRIEAHAKVSERSHFISSPNEALHYARARGFIWASPDDFRYRADATFYALPTQSELDSIWSWVATLPNLLLRADLPWQAIVGSDKLSILMAADTEGLCRIVAAKMCIPAEVAKKEVMPQLFLRMSESFVFRVCSEDYPFRQYDDSLFGKELLWLQKREGPARPLPDLFDTEWTTRIFSADAVRLDQDRLEFLVTQARRHAFVGPVLHVSKGILRIRPEAFSAFSRRSEWGEENRVQGVFRERFEKAGWLQLP